MALDDTTRQAALKAIAAHLAEVGPKDWSAVRERFSDIPHATWWRLVREVRGGAAQPESLEKARKKLDKRLRKAPKPEAIKAHLPAAPSPDYIARHGEEGLRQFDFMRELTILFDDALLLREYALNNEGKIKIPMFFEKSIRLRGDILETGLTAAKEVFDLQRIEAFHEAILEEIRQVSPECAHRIIERLHKMNTQFGWSHVPGA